MLQYKERFLVYILFVLSYFVLLITAP